MLEAVRGAADLVVEVDEEAAEEVAEEEPTEEEPTEEDGAEEEVAAAAGADGQMAGVATGMAAGEAAGEAEGAMEGFGGTELLPELRPAASAAWLPLVRPEQLEGEAQQARLQAEAELMRRAILQAAAEPQPGAPAVADR